MSSVVDICNIALSHLGDTATVASIDPPEGSAQAEHCARFYPIARDSVLEMHDWSFATRRLAGSLLSSDIDQWDYTYAWPNNCLRILAVMPEDATDDYVQDYPKYTTAGYIVENSYGYYQPEAFCVEVLETGVRVVRCNTEDALLRFTEKVTDPQRFSPLFVDAVSWYLASMLAGPLIKGDAGAAEAKRCLQMAMAILDRAKSSDSNQRDIKPLHIVPWMRGRS